MNITSFTYVSSLSHTLRVIVVGTCTRHAHLHVIVTIMFYRYNPEIDAAQPQHNPSDRIEPGGRVDARRVEAEWLTASSRDRQRHDARLVPLPVPAQRASRDLAV